MCDHTIRLAQIRQTEFQEQAYQAACIRRLRGLDIEKINPTTRDHNLIHRVGGFLIGAGRWLKSGHRLSF
jgi:hypothetical protein